MRILLHSPFTRIIIWWILLRDEDYSIPAPFVLLSVEFDWFVVSKDHTPPFRHTNIARMALPFRSALSL